MELLTISIEDQASDKVHWLLSHLEDSVRILESKKGESANREDWREIYESISAWEIDETTMKMPSWKIDEF